MKRLLIFGFLVPLLSFGSGFLGGSGSGGASAFSDLTGTAAVTQGGTGLTTATAGDILYASAANTWAKLAKGTDGEFLKLASGIPDWATVSLTSTAAMCYVSGSTTTASYTSTDKIIDWDTCPVGDSLVTQGTSWAYTAPETGNYHICAKVWGSTDPASAVNYNYGKVFVNGSEPNGGRIWNDNYRSADAYLWNFGNCTTLPVTAGQEITIKGWTDGGTYTLDTNVGSSHVTIHRVY